MYKILICGDREWKDAPFIEAMLQAEIVTAQAFGDPNVQIVVIHGDARGADKLGARAALNLGIQEVPFPAQWDTFGKAAGPVRNQAMIEQEPNIVLAFHDDILHSKGTLDMLQRAKKNGTAYKIFAHTGCVVHWTPQARLLA